MSANIRETRLCLGFHKQAALQTPLVAADCWSLLKTNPAPFVVDLKTESDAAWIGKDDEFATQNFLTNWDVTGAVEGFLSSEWAAMISVFGLGHVAKTTVTGGFKYTCTPLVPVSDEIEMPSTTIVEAIRQGGSSVLDRALVGCCIEEFGFEFNAGPGLQNSRFTSSWVGCGKSVSPSTITVPAATTQHLLKGYSLACTILGTNYISAKSLQSFTFKWKNNLRLDSGFYPGSGSSDSAQIRGRMEHGDREMSSSFVARFAHGSTELTNLLAQTEGTAIVSISGDEISAGVPHMLTITEQRVTIRSAVVGEADGIVTVAVDLLPMTHVSNGLVKIEVQTATDEIGTVAA